jgi:hypothetical protein
MTTKVPAAMVDSDVATQAELDAEAALRAASNIKLPGDVLQFVYTQPATVVTGTTVLPYDNTIPQITEGIEYTTLSITPQSASSILVIEAGVMIDHTSNGALTLALFQDATANALKAVASEQATAVELWMTLKHIMVAGTTSAITFRIRGGSSTAGTTTMGGNASAALFGGVAGNYLTITEIKA